MRFVSVLKSNGELRGAMLTAAAIALLSFGCVRRRHRLIAARSDRAHECGDTILPRNHQRVPQGTERNVGKPIASRSVVFTSVDGKKKVTLSVDKYAMAMLPQMPTERRWKGARPRPGSSLRRRRIWGTKRSPALAGRRRDAFKAWRTQWQSDHLRHACRLHPCHAQQFEQPLRSRRHGASKE